MCRGRCRLHGPAPTSAEIIRARVWDELQLRCSVGVAPNKFLAKLASVAAKPVASPDRRARRKGVVEVCPGQELAFLHPLPVQALWGVGPATLQRLQRLGVQTVADLADLDEVDVGRLRRRCARPASVPAGMGRSTTGRSSRIER